MHACMHACYACIHAYMHTCIHAYMHTCIHAYMHTCIHTYIHDFVNNNLPPPLMDLYTRNSEIHQHNTRHNIDIHLPKVNFDIVRRSFIFKGPDLWIKLDPSIKCSNTRTSFKYKLRHKLLSAY